MRVVICRGTSFVPSSFPISCERVRLATHSFPSRMRTRVRNNLARRTSSASALACMTSISPAQRRRVLIIAGPTGVGKSSLAFELARKLGGELVSADSVQVYRGLDIGSNKASPLEQSTVPHHLLDVSSPAEPYSAGSFFRAARAAVEDIAQRGLTPIVVGGTMMYVRWFMHGCPATPPPDPQVVERVDARVAALGGNWNAARALLAECDPVRAEQVNENDWYRLKRALQISETTRGMGVSGVPPRGAAPNARRRGARELDHDFRCIFLFSGRVLLNRRNDARCESMILPKDPNGDFVPEGSILSEVGRLLVSRELVHGQSSPARAIGYRQTIEYILSRAEAALKTRAAAVPNRTSSVDGSELPARPRRDQGNSALGRKANECDDQSVASAEMAFRQFVEDFQQATRVYAKQQINWFRKDMSFVWVPAGPDSVSKIADLYALDEESYLGEVEKIEVYQRYVRADMVAQGKEMKTYISTRESLAPESEGERMAIQLAEKMAQCVSECVSLAEIQDFRNSLRRTDLPDT